VVWQGSAGDRRPYADLVGYPDTVVCRWKLAPPHAMLSGNCTSRMPAWRACLGHLTATLNDTCSSAVDNGRRHTPQVFSDWAHTVVLSRCAYEAFVLPADCPVPVASIISMTVPRTSGALRYRVVPAVAAAQSSTTPNPRVSRSKTFSYLNRTREPFKNLQLFEHAFPSRSNMGICARII
jgi:hypothetical protein